MEHVDKVHEKKHQDQGATKNTLLRWGYVLHPHHREEGHPRRDRFMLKNVSVPFGSVQMSFQLFLIRVLCGT